MDGGAFRIALDVAPLRSRPAGVGVYVRGLAGALAQLRPSGLALIGARAEADLDGLAALPRVPFTRRHYHAWMQLDAARMARRSGADLVHFTNAAAPLFGGRPYVLTVHDLSVMRMPRSHPLARLATAPVTIAAIRGARRIVVPSAATADELRRLLRTDRQRVEVIEHAASLFPPADKRVAAAAIHEMLGLEPAGYVVALGTVEPRKNHRRLVAAFETLVDDGRDLRLVVVGEPGWHAGPITERIQSSRHRERIAMTGYLPDAQLAQLIAGSAAVAYVSLYEGYGLPVVDAMSVGAAVVTSRASSMPQVADGAAVLVDPLDVADIARGLSEAIERRDELVEAGLARTAARSWHDVGRETLSVYERALAR